MLVLVRQRRAFWASLALTAGLALTTPSAAIGQADGERTKRVIAETDLFSFTWIADPQISPDGRFVAFVKVAVNGDRSGYDTSLWLVPTDATTTERRLTTGTRDLAPRWSPDGTRLAFLRTVGSAAQIHLLSLHGGEAIALTDLPRGASAPAWAPDGTRLAFTSTTRPDDLGKRDPGERVSDVRVITQPVYRANGGGYLDPSRRSSIWTVAVPTSPSGPLSATRVTSGEFDETRPTWSADSQQIFFTSTRVPDPDFDLPDRDVFVVAATGGSVTRVASIDGMLGTPVLSPDGRQLAMTGTLNLRPGRSYDQPDLFVSDVTAGSPVTNLTKTYDFDIGGSLTGDQRAPRGNFSTTPVWAPDSASLIVGAAKEGRLNLVRVDAASGDVTPLTTGDHDLMAFTASADGTQMAVLISTPTEIGDIYALDVATAGLRRLTRVNESLLSTLSLTPPEEMWVKSFDGRKIHTFVQRPPDYDPGKRYPLILNIHGGPHSAYGFTFDHEFQWMAAKGYIVVYPNPRGSTTYGQEFGNIIQFHYPGDDAKDLLAAVDAVIAEGGVDPSRLGVTGGSGGGVLTNWIVTQTDKFAAAVSQRSIADWATFWYTADFALFSPTWFRKAPWEDRADFAARSAITFVDRIKTPMMFIEGEQDWRTPPAAGGEQLFRALLYRKVPTVLVQFPGEDHELSRSGQPWHRVERLRHIVSWFDRFLREKETATFD